jgi:hypothetical protein
MVRKQIQRQHREKSPFCSTWPRAKRTLPSQEQELRLWDDPLIPKNEVGYPATRREANLPH